MRTVELWSCSCGTLYRAVCEIESTKSKIKSFFVCEKCEDEVALQGTILLCSEQQTQTHWLPLNRTA